MTLSIVLVIILLLLLCSAFFSASETALTAVTQLQIHQMMNKDPKKGKRVKALSLNMGRVLGTVLLGNNLVNILAASLAAHIFIKLFDESGIGIATLCMTFLILIFAEVMPKLYAIHNPERVSLMVSPLMQWCVRVFSPITQVVRRLAENLWEMLGVSLRDKDQNSFHEELRGAIDIFTLHERKDQKEMLHGILDLSFVNIEEVMIHRKDVETINKRKSLKDIRAQVMKSPYTRLPVWEKSSDNIVGILHVKTFLQRMDESQDFPLEEAYQSPLFAPETTSLADQIEVFRATRQHMSIVVDEYGDVQGIVTLEDILEEVIGQMLDEHDVRKDGIHGNPKEGYKIKGATTLRDIKRKLGWKLSHKKATTLGGFLMHESQAIPNVGQVYQFQGFQFKILKCHHHQVTLVHMSR
jgi:Mg2+/Co2+ transporter CorB